VGVFCNVESSSSDEGLPVEASDGLVLVEPHQRIKVIFTKIESTIEN
jgi:hypothetical protein